jgi:hypothetical protein
VEKDDKYRIVKQDKQTLKNCVTKHKAGVQLMLLIGFEQALNE